MCCWSTIRQTSRPTRSSAATGTSSASSRPKRRSRAAARTRRKRSGWSRRPVLNSSSLYQYAGIMKVLEKHPDFQVVAKPDSNWDATTSRNVTTTMLQQHPDICSIIDFWDGDATGASAAIRDAKLDGKVFLSPPAAARRRPTATS
ncbi:substrate-binding domain-containing protein [Mesorhizobium atlanticum]